MSDIRQKIAKSLIGVKLGLTARELAESLELKTVQITGALGQMVAVGLVEKGEKLEVEGQLYLITEKGIAEFGGKNVESALAQIEKKPVIESEPAPIVIESALAQIEENPVESKEILRKMELDTFEVYQLTDELASSFIKIIESKQAKPKPIENIEWKIATLESLADIYNSKISATLREIVVDLRG